MNLETIFFSLVMILSQESFPVKFLDEPETIEFKTGDLLLFKNIESLLNSNTESKNKIHLPEICYDDFKCIVNICNNTETSKFTFDRIIKLTCLSDSLGCKEIETVCTFLHTHFEFNNETCDEIKKIYAEIDLSDHKYCDAVARISRFLLDDYILKSYIFLSNLKLESNIKSIPFFVMVQENSNNYGIRFGGNQFNIIFPLYLNYYLHNIIEISKDIIFSLTLLKMENLIYFEKYHHFNTIYIRAFVKRDLFWVYYMDFMLRILLASKVFPDISRVIFYGCNFMSVESLKYISLKTIGFEACMISTECLFELCYEKMDLEQLYITNSCIIPTPIQRETNNINNTSNITALETFRFNFKNQKRSYIKPSIKTLKIFNCMSSKSINIDNLKINKSNTSISALEIMVNANSNEQNYSTIFSLPSLISLTINIESYSKNFFEIFNECIEKLNYKDWK